MDTKEEDEEKKITFKARSRLMLLLGEQLITDEVAAVSELVKNSYDADAKKVKVELLNVSKKEQGTVVIIDNGNGMTKDQLLTSWLELGSISKIRKEGEKARVSEKLERLYLGEKGLGRLAVHKIGKRTEIITRREGEEFETRMILDWKLFEDETKFLDDIEIVCKEQAPEIFTKNSEWGFDHGTKIIITDLQRNWTTDRIKRVKEFIWSFESPFAPIKDFEIEDDIQDEKDSEIVLMNTDEIKESAHYFFEATIDQNGIAEMYYKFNSPVYPENTREKRWEDEKRIDFRKPPLFTEIRKTECGPFKVTIYCWELDPAHRRATFGKGDIFSSRIKPQTGMKVIRDDFRVFPYGNEDNDWLGMDQERISQFRLRLSRNQILGFVQISAKSNPKLIDKSDREGLIDNQSFTDFKFLTLAVLSEFEAERYSDRMTLGHSKRLDPRLNRIADELKKINLELEKHNIDTEGKQRITKLIDETVKHFEKTLEEIETPLLGAASIGLTYLLPTHELKRNIHETVKILKASIKSGSKNFVEDAKKAIEQLEVSTKIIRGLTRIQEKDAKDENLRLKIPIENAISVLERKLKRNHIEVEIEDNLDDGRLVTDRQSIIIMLLNMIDNSIYWVSSNATSNRKIKFVIDEIDGHKAIIVSDNGQGFEDTLELVINPFFTRKTGGLGLGLFICSRVAEFKGYSMKILAGNEIPNLLSGANIAIIFGKGDKK